MNRAQGLSHILDHSLCLTHPIERVVEPGKGEEEDVGVEGGEGRPERLHDAEDEMETVKGHQT